MTTGPGLPERARNHASLITASMLPMLLTETTCLAVGPKTEATSICWKESVPILCSGTCPAITTIGTPSA